MSYTVKCHILNQGNAMKFPDHVNTIMNFYGKEYFQDFPFTRYHNFGLVTENILTRYNKNF